MVEEEVDYITDAREMSDIRITEEQGCNEMLLRPLPSKRVLSDCADGANRLGRNVGS